MEVLGISLSDYFTDPNTIKKMIICIFLFVFLQVCRKVFLKFISRNKKLTFNEKRYYFVTSRYILVILFIVLACLFWLEEIKTFALSTLALGVAFVLFFQEIIKSLIGSFYLFVNKPFKVGDIIQVGDNRGEVTEQNFLSTTLWDLALGKDVRLFTGKKVVIPNSYFVSQPIFNENNLGKFSFYTFQLPLFEGENWSASRTFITQKVMELVDEFKNDATAYWKRQSEKNGYKMPDINPKVYFHIATDQNAWLYVRLCCPGSYCSEIRYKLHLAYFEAKYRGEFRK